VSRLQRLQVLDTERVTEEERAKAFQFYGDLPHSKVI
jgi:hypothetical protein